MAVVAVSANAAHTWTDLNGNVHQQVSPVENQNNYYAEALSQDTRYSYQTGETHATDYGSKLATPIIGDAYRDDNTLVAKYKIDGKNIVEVIARQSENAAATKSYFVEGADGRLTAVTTSDFDTSKLVKENFLEGGVVTSSFSKNGQIEEIKRINNETVKYGQISSTNSTSTFEGATIAPTGVSNPFNDTVNSVNQYNEKSVELGILAQKTIGDVTSNVYGLSAKDGQNVSSLTGNGLQTKNIVLANGDIQTVDGRHGITTLVNRTSSANQLVSEYLLANDQKVWVVTDVTTQEKQYFTGSADQLVEYTGSKDVLTNLNAGGALTTVTGVYRDSSVRNVITDQKVTYSEKSYEYDADVTTGQTTTTDGLLSSSINSKQPNGAARNQTEQSVDLGVIGKNEDSSNKYGLEVSKTNTDTEGKVTTAKTTITADYVDSGDFRINGVSIVDSIKSSVDGAVAGASEAIDAKVAEVDSKIVEVDARLTQFNTTAANLNSRVDQLNSRVNEVEEKAYRGVAIALAAQQQIPNIGAGQFAVFGGVGHYEGESAGALGVASVFADGRTSLSAAIGVAGGSEVGGRVGLSYVFGGK
ncbi:YadA-like family protein [Acinetobacter amyesii]|uniref:YadA-like family protein n=1 Tax=Acinetobacter amyesii TaxID=2942470 RepID=UPI0020BF1D08|nr:YadA C-terminal domain-containing protein [Acinetobacter amyesii]MCL6232946.1 YadA C-terminal domain-containing protein [Acinetobacter amyesii]